MVSYKHKLILIHNPKTASTAMRGALMDIWDDPWPGHLSDNGKSSFHELPHECKSRIGSENYSEFLKFVFVRNPWDRMVSHYHYYKKRNNPYIADWESFDSWARDIPGLDRKRRNTTNQTKWTTGMDFVGRFENLEADWRHMLELAGVPYRPLKVVNPSVHDHYSTYYDDTTRDIVAKRFSEDIERFGYKFGE